MSAMWARHDPSQVAQTGVTRAGLIHGQFVNPTAQIYGDSSQDAVSLPEPRAWDLHMAPGLRRTRLMHDMSTD